MTRETVMKKVQQIIAERGSQKAAAEFFEVSESYLSDLLYERRDPGEKILSKLGLQSKVVYEPAKPEVAA